MGRVYARRLEWLQGLAEEKGLCGVLVDGESNVFYFTGYRGAGYLVAGRDGFALVVPILEYLNALHSVEEIGLDGLLEVVAFAPYGLPSGLVVEEAGIRVIEKKLGDVAAEILCKSEDGRRCGVVTGAKRVWDSVATSCNPIDLSDEVARKRMIKEPWEIERMSTAAEIAAAALRHGIEELRDGVTEAEAAGIIYAEMRRLGADDYSFPPIVAFGSNTVYPHAVPSAFRRLSGPTTILIDLGAKYKGYSSDMTRTMFHGGSPPEFRHVAEAVLDALEAAIDVARAGVKAGEVDAAARRVLGSYKLDKYFIHSLGHGIGIDVHEPPRVSHGSNIVLEEGMVITIEPGVYIPGKFGVRIEEMVLVTSRKAIRLTRFETKLW